MASALIDTVSADIDNNGYLFRASGHTVKFKGYRYIYDDSDENADKDGGGMLPPLEEGETLSPGKLCPSSISPSRLPDIRTVLSSNFSRRRV